MRERLANVGGGNSVVIAGMDAGGRPRAVSVDKNGFLETGGMAMPVAATPAPRRIWLPSEIEFDTPGADGRFEGYRYISGGTAPVYSQVLSMEGCEDLAIWITAGKTPQGPKTLTMLVYMGPMGGQDMINNSDYVNPLSGSANVLTTATNASTHWQFFTRDMTTTDGVRKRGFSPNYWCLKVTASAAGMPFTVWAMGR